MTTATARLAIVTGTTSGIGHAVTRCLLEAGWDVLGLARRPAPFSGAGYRHATVDLGDAMAIDRVVAEQVAPVIRERAWGRVGLVNNAASADLLTPVERIDARTLAPNLTLNLVAPIALMAAVSREAPRATAVRIVNVSSGAAGQPFGGMAAYCSAKAALRMAGMVLAEEWQSTTLHAPTRTDGAILSYEPGIVDTAMQEQARDRPAEEFPWVGMFQTFEAEGALVSADLPAREIVAFLANVTAPPFTETRLSP